MLPSTSDDGLVKVGLGAHAPAGVVPRPVPPILSMGPTPPPIPRLEVTMTVGELLRRHPVASAVFDAFGVDGRRGDRTLRDAAREDGANCCAFVAALEWALGEAAET